MTSTYHIPNPLLIGMTGDYRPMSFYNPETNTLQGYDVDLAKEIGNKLGVEINFVLTSWPTLEADLLNKKFDFAISGITITEERKAKFLMSKGYMNIGKTFFCRKKESNRFTDLESLNNPEITVVVNPGGTNQQFVEAYLSKCKVLVHNKNHEIPELIAKGFGDIMITETVEAEYYCKQNPDLAAPLMRSPFTQNQFGVLLRKESSPLLKLIEPFLPEAQ